MSRNRHLVVILVCVLALALVVTGGVWAATGKVKPKPKTPANPKNKATLGTHQMAGEDHALIGTTYTLGKANPINVTLDKVEYTVEPVRIGSSIFAPRADQKLMVLHYSLHNCVPRNYGISWGTLEITAVDANDTNWRYVTQIGIEDTLEQCNMSLKPGQKTKVYTCIVVPAKGEIPKLMLQSGDKLVLRYDLRGKLKPLPPPIADPADPTGATALEKVPAQMGVYYAYKEHFGEVDSVAFSTTPINGKAPPKNCRYLLVIGKGKNPHPAKFRYSWGTFAPKLQDVDGGTVSWGDTVLFASRDDTLNAEVEQGQEIGFRILYIVKNGVQLKSLSMSEGGGRQYVYDVSSVK